MQTNASKGRENNMCKHKFKVGTLLVDKVSEDAVCTIIKQLQGVDCNLYFVVYMGDTEPVLRSETVLNKYYKVK